MIKYIFNNNCDKDELIAWLDTNIGTARSRMAGHGWVIANNFNFRARRRTTFWVEFEDWVTEEQRLAFTLTWSR